jgi:serine/threonine protein kinase
MSEREVFSATLEPTDQAGPASCIAHETIGAVIGCYKLLQSLGESGMSAVFLAEQKEHAPRSVALKIINPVEDSPLVRARFEAERQALAQLDHPNIAKVFDGGTTHSGRPFLVMELVEGISITKYCDNEHLSLHERLKLFITVCQAVHHTHESGIIHRDLKPSSVLIALEDRKPILKIVDFGGAQVTQPSASPTAGKTLGMLQYRAPEQAEPNNFDIDTRADIFALGVLLYELLTGSPPLPTRQLQPTTFAEMLRLIQGAQPPKPSTRLSTSAELPNIAGRRKLTPKMLMRLAQNDLDWIVMKCLEKDKGRRYQSASALAIEVQCYMAHEPVLARPPSRVYRLRKFLRRNQRRVLAVAVLALLVLGGIVGATVGVPLLEQAFQEQKVVVGPDDPETLASLNRLGVDYYNAGKFELAVPLFERTLEKQKAVLGSDHPATLTTMRNLIHAYRAIGKHKLALPLVEEMFGKHKARLGPDDPDTLASMNELAAVYRATGKLGLAQSLFEETLKKRKAKLGPDHPDTLNTMHWLALVYQDAGKLNQALELFELTLEKQQLKLGADHANTLTTMHNLAVAYQAARKLDRAVALFELTVKQRKATHGADHADTLNSMHWLALAYQDAGKLKEALALFEDVLTKQKVNPGADHRDTITTMHNLAGAYEAANELDRAVALFEEAVQKQRSVRGPDHPSTMNTMFCMARACQAAGKFSQAVPLYEQLLEIQKVKLGADHADSLSTMYQLAWTQQMAGRPHLALPWLEQTLDKRRVKLGPEHPDTLLTMEKLALTYGEVRAFAKSEVLWRDLSVVRKKHHPDQSETADALRGLGETLLHQKKYAEAELPLRECLAIRAKTRPDAWNTFSAKSLLGAALIGQRRYNAAETLLIEGYQGMQQRGAPTSRLVNAAQRLVQLYEAWRRPEQAAKWRKQTEALEHPTPAPKA